MGKQKTGSKVYGELVRRQVTYSLGSGVFKNIFNFLSNFRFTEKLMGKHRDFPHIPLRPTHSFPYYSLLVLVRYICYN